MAEKLERGLAGITDFLTVDPVLRLFLMGLGGHGGNGGKIVGKFHLKPKRK